MEFHVEVANWIERFRAVLKLSSCGQCRKSTLVRRKSSQEHSVGMITSRSTNAESRDDYLEIDEALAELEQRSFVIVLAVPREIPRQMLER